MPLSYSRLSTFESCPRKFEYLYVLKSIKDEGSTATEYGTRVHGALENYGKALVSESLVELEALTEVETEATRWFPMVKKICDRPGEKLFEHQMAVTRDKVPCDWFAADVWLRSIADVLIIDGKKAYCLDWKGLSLDTKLPTPAGFTTMGEVAVGDTLFSESGEQCTVVGKSEVKNIRCYRVRFDDTTEVVCDENHLWKLHDGSVVPVTALAVGARVLVAAPLALPDVQLPVDPYVLGLWLADGKRTSGEITKPDAFVWDEISRRGYGISHDYSERAQDGKCRVHTVKGLRGQLRRAGLLGNKHIPSDYLRAGYQQRIDLLRGLMDGDGSANPTRKQAVFTTTDERMSDAVCELLSTLGQRPLKSKVQAHGFGLDVTAYPVSFRPQGINPFLLPRKRDRICASWGAGNSWRRKVVSVDSVSSVPTQCISVDSADHTFLCTERMVPTHNTGKKKDNPTQMQLFAAMVFLHFPEVEEVVTSFVWLVANDMTNVVYQRRYADSLWVAIEPRLVAVQEAVDLGVFKAKPSGLCPWCPAQDICGDAKKGKRK